MADVLSVIADVLKQDKQQKREHNKMMREVQKKLKEKNVSEEEGDKDEYMKFFSDTLKKFGVKSPAELSDEDKKKFFNQIDKGWKGDNEKAEEVEKKESLGKRVKARMEQEDDEDIGELPDQEDVPVEDEDDDPVGEPEEDDEPSEEEIEKIADLVVQKIKDKADEEEDEEEEPDATEAESGKEEKIDVNPKMEQARNPHARNTWAEALRKVNTFSEEKLVEGGHTDVASAKNQVKVAKSALMKMETELNKLPEDGTLPSWWTNKVAIAVDKLDGMADYLDTQVEQVKEAWIDNDARKVERKWSRMNKNAKKKWMDGIMAKAEKEGMPKAELMDVLDDYGLTEATSYLDVRGYGDEGTTTSDTDKDYGLHQFSDPKYKPAYTDQSFKTAPDMTGIGQDLGDKKSGTPKKAVGKATDAIEPAKDDPKTGMDKIPVPTKSSTPDTAVGKATDAKIAPRVTTKDGVATQKEDVKEKFKKWGIQLKEVGTQSMGVHDPIDSEEKLEVGSHPDWPEQPKKKKKKVTEKRSVSFARKFYQKENK